MNGILNESTVVKEYGFIKTLIRKIDSILIIELEIHIIIIVIHLTINVYMIFNLPLLEIIKYLI